MLTTLRRLRHALAAALLFALVVAVPAGARAYAGSAPVPDGRLVNLRALTYNIQAGAGLDHVFDPARQIDALRAQNADIIALEEVDVHWGARSQWRDLATEIASGLGMNVFFGPIYDLDPPSAGAPRRQFGIALLSRYPILKAENHWITRLSTQTANPVPQPAPGFPEILVNVDGALVHVYGTHLDYRSDPAVRTMQVADMLRILRADAGQRQVLMGDFNAGPGAEELAPLWGYLTDAWPVAGGAGSGRTYPANTPTERIDFITVTPRVGVRTVRVPYTLASDHRPVVADLTVTRGQNGVY